VLATSSLWYICDVAVIRSRIRALSVMLCYISVSEIKFYQVVTTGVH